MTLSLTDPTGTSPVVAALEWLQGTLLGTIATTVAVIAIATVGVMMLGGRINVRHGVTTILGCFVLFGASSIAAGIRATASSMSGDGSEQVMTEPSAAIVIPPRPPSNYDPYAGASVPQR